jgi:hypothetical protein
MTEAQLRILELFRTLTLGEQRSIVEKLTEAAYTQALYDRMTPEQRRKLDEGIAQSDTGDVTPAADVFDRLAARFDFSRI